MHSSGGQRRLARALENFGEDHVEVAGLAQFVDERIAVNLVRTQRREQLERARQLAVLQHSRDRALAELRASLVPCLQRACEQQRHHVFACAALRDALRRHCGLDAARAAGWTSSA